MIEYERKRWDSYDAIQRVINSDHYRITNYKITQSVDDSVRIDLSIEPYLTYIDTDMAATKEAFKNYILEGKKMPIKTGIEYELKGFTFVPVTNKYNVKKIIHSGLWTIVTWEDGTITKVKMEDDGHYDEYAAFTAALAKKVYGSNSKVHKILETKTVEQKQKSKKKEDSKC